MSTVLEVKDLVKHYPGTRGRHVKAVNGISLSLTHGETLGLVGESGCGKTTVGRCIVRLEDVTSGTIQYRDTNLAQLSHKAMWPYRKDIQMVFQDPFDSLNPRISVGTLVEEPLHLFDIGAKTDRRQRVQQLFKHVGLQRAHLTRYPHQLSGGQQQRVGIARALATNPSIVVLDEPTTALDVSVQATILNLLKSLQQEMNLSYLLISHDLSVVGFMAHRVAVMYLGQIVEEGPTQEILNHPKHPYTLALLTALPEAERSNDLIKVKMSGEVPSPLDVPVGCALAGRCPFARDECKTTRPQLQTVGDGHWAACHLVAEIQMDGVRV